MSCFVLPWSYYQFPLDSCGDICPYPSGLLFLHKPIESLDCPSANAVTLNGMGTKPRRNTAKYEPPCTFLGMYVLHSITTITQHINFFLLFTVPFSCTNITISRGCENSSLNMHKDRTNGNLNMFFLWLTSCISGPNTTIIQYEIFVMFIACSTLNNMIWYWPEKWYLD